MRMYSPSVLWLCCFLASGCSSDVDKCVDVFLRSVDFKNTPTENKAKVEYIGRIACLKAASGKE